MGAFSLRVPIYGLYQYALQECMRRKCALFLCIGDGLQRYQEARSSYGMSVMGDTSALIAAKKAKNKLLNTIVSILNCNRMYIEAISASSCVRHSS